MLFGRLAAYRGFVPKDANAVDDVPGACPSPPLAPLHKGGKRIGRFATRATTRGTKPREACVGSRLSFSMPRWPFDAFRSPKAAFSLLPTQLFNPPRWPWVILGLGLVWTVLIRVPLLLNAEDHLDSDLAVDGLTLRDAVSGHWRWHYPGTPHIGILPVLASYPQALIWGANAATLVSGGTLIWILVVVSTFCLAWVVFGPEVAGWGIVPLVFSSLGTIWLSGRITGGHLLGLVWHTGAFLGLYVCLNRGGWARAAVLGVWCGLGLYADTMFAFTLAGLIPAAILAWLRGGRSQAGIHRAVVFLAALAAGVIPREIGRRVQPLRCVSVSIRPDHRARSSDRARASLRLALPAAAGCGHRAPCFWWDIW